MSPTGLDRLRGRTLYDTQHDCNPVDLATKANGSVTEIIPGCNSGSMGRGDAFITAGVLKISATDTAPLLTYSARHCALPADFGKTGQRIRGDAL